MLECQAAGPGRYLVTKFEEMCKAFTDARTYWFAYRDRSSANLAILASEFLKYCDLPRGNVRYGTPGKELEGDMPIPAVVEFDPNTGYWQVNIYVTLYEAPNIYPHHQTRFRLALCESDNKTLVKLGWEKKPREIDVTDKGQRDEFYADIVVHFKQFFDRRPQVQEVKGNLGFTLD
jgi:hypothetical protein